MKPLMVILMGSKSDLAHAQKIAEPAQAFGFEVILRVASAHKTAAYALQLLSGYESDPRPKVYVTIAGRSNALSGFTDGAVSAPVIACPPASENFAGADIYSSLRMPSGIAPAVVLEPANAALLAAKIMAVGNPEMLQKVKEYQKKMQEIILNDDQQIQTN